MAATQPHTTPSATLLLRLGFGAFYRHPVLILPIFTCSILQAPLLAAAIFWAHWAQLSPWSALELVAGVLLLVTFSLTFACLVQLELIEQIESNHPVSLLRASSNALIRDLPRALPIALVWTIIWLVVTVLDAFSSQRNKNCGAHLHASPVDVTHGKRLGIWQFFTALLKKGMRMTVFMILPPVAWENLWTLAATRRGLVALRTHLDDFTAGFILSEITALVLLLPPGVLLFLTHSSHVDPSPTIWWLLILTLTVTYSLILYIEQFVAAELYLWHLKWLAACEQAHMQGADLPSIRQIPRPSILDETPDLLRLNEVG